MITASRRSMCYRTDPFEVGQYALNFWSGLMTRYLRDRPLFEGKHRFIDISFRDITGKRPETAERIYAGAGIPLTEAGRSAMTAWEAANTQHKHGTHRYQLSDAGLTEQDVAQAFGAYEAKYAKFF